MEVVNTADVLVLGSGPAGVSAAWPLVDAGLKVLMLEAGEQLEYDNAPRDRPSRAQLRRTPLNQQDEQAWDHLLGDDLRVLKPQTHKFPKLRFLLGDGSVENYLAKSHVEANDFDAIGVFARGGLSTVWGAGASVFNPGELTELPFPAKDLLPSYLSVAKRIGVSGSATDDMASYHGLDIPLQDGLQLSPLAAAVLDRYEARRHKLRLRMGRSRLAVLSEDLGNRHGCKLCSMCGYGCAERSIYSSADELPELESHGNFTCQDHARVTRIERTGQGYAVLAVGKDGRTTDVFHASTVVVATGVLNTTRLVLRLMELYDREVPVLDVPTVAFGLIAPRLLGRGLPEESFAFSQLTFRLELPAIENQSVSGSLYTGDHFQASDLIPRVPLSYVGARSVIRSIMPALLFGTMWFPSRYGQSRACLKKDTGVEDHRLVIDGGFSSDFDSARRAALKLFRRQARKIGIYQLPGGVEYFQPGGAARIGGTLAMGSLTTAEGEVAGAPNLFVADASSLPCMQPKSVVMTAMANADRIGRIIAGRILGDSGRLRQETSKEATR